MITSSESWAKKNIYRKYDSTRTVAFIIVNEAEQATLMLLLFLADEHFALAIWA
jgi:hypothetical protein